MLIRNAYNYKPFFILGSYVLFTARNVFQNNILLKVLLHLLGMRADQSRRA